MSAVRDVCVVIFSLRYNYLILPYSIPSKLCVASDKRSVFSCTLVQGCNDLLVFYMDAERTWRRAARSFLHPYIPYALGCGGLAATAGAISLPGCLLLHTNHTIAAAGIR